jgi:hypothetical protein
MDDNPYKSPETPKDEDLTMPGLAKYLGYVGILAGICYIVGFSAWLGLTSLLSWFLR